MTMWRYKREHRTARPYFLPLVVLFFAVSVGSFAQRQTIERPFRGVTHVTREETDPRPVVMHVVTVNLTERGVRVKVSPPAGTRETLRETTLSFLTRERAQIAINAHFFLPFPSTDVNAEVIGLAASEGKVYSACERPVQSYALVANAPAINFDREGRAAVVGCDAESSLLWNALAGSAQIITNGVVTIPAYKDATHPDGALTPNSDYSNSRSWYDLPRARSAIGLTRDNRTLVLFTVESGRNGEMSGLSVMEVATLLVRDYAVHNALNLDGGGSTSLVIDGKMVTSGSREVASSLAIFAER